MADKTKAELEKELAEKIAKIEELETALYNIDKLEKKIEELEAVRNIPLDNISNNEIDINVYLNERIPFTAFKDNDKYKDDLIVGVNGKNYQIQRGIGVMIPRFVYMAIRDSDKQDLDTSKFLEMKIAEYNENIKNLV